MKKKLKTFPNSKINIFLLVILLICCTAQPENDSENENFVNIYAQLLIINELKIDTLKKQSLADSVYMVYGSSAQDTRQTLGYYQHHPEAWVIVLQKIRDRIREIKNKELFLKPGNSEPVDQGDQQPADH